MFMYPTGEFRKGNTAVLPSLSEDGLRPLQVVQSAVMSERTGTPEKCDKNREARFGLCLLPSPQPAVHSTPGFARLVVDKEDADTDTSRS